MTFSTASKPNFYAKTELRHEGKCVRRARNVALWPRVYENALFEVIRAVRFPAVVRGHLNEALC
jgi:hypothetical protein